MFIFNEISSGGPGLFFVVALWTLFRYALQNNLHTSWLHTCCLFFEQLASPIYKKYKVVSKGQFSNSSTGSCLSSVFYPPGLSPLIKSSRPDFHALLSGSVQKAGFLLGILMVLSLANINAATIKSTASGGDWSSKTSWIGGIVPANGDDVSIPAGSTVTIDTNPIVGSLSVSGILQFEVSTARSIIVLTQVTVNSGGVFQSAQTGAVKNHQLIVQGSVINDGKIDFSSNSNATGVELVFTGSGNAIFNCSDAPLTNLKQSNGITLNKGTSAVSVLSFTPGNTFQVLSNGSSSAKGFLSIINGTFNIIGSNSFTNPVFNTEGDYTIPATGGFWLGNQNATVTGINGTVTNLGELKITNGTYRIGISGGKSSGILNIGQFKMSGGNTNIAGKFNVEAGECSISGGEINITTGGYTADNEPTFNVSPQAKLEVYGNPLITIEYPKSVKVPFNDIQILEGSGTKSIRGGTFQLGTANTPFASTFFVNSDIQFYKIAVFNECSLRIVDTSKNQFNSKVNGVFPKLDSENGGLTLTAPENKTVKCNDLIPEPYTSLQSFLNDGGKSLINCTLIAASFKLIGQTQSGTRCPYTITRTYEVADIFGNVETVEHLIVVEGEAVEPQSETLVEPAKEEVLRLKSAMANISSTATGGDWNVGTSWVGGAVPLPGDDVTIVAGATITLTDNRTCNDIAIAGTLAISGTNTLQVNGSLTNSGNISSASGKILLSGNWTNSGTYNGGTNGIVEFTGASNAIISGTTNFEELIINKGNLASTLTINGPTTVLSSGGLTMTSGLVTIPVGGTFTVIPSSGIFIPEIAGFDVTGGTLNTRDFTITNEGLIRISSGTANFGNSSGNSVHTQTDGVFQVSGTSVVNIAGRLENSASGTLTPPGLTSGITISGGTVTLSTVGNGLSSVGSLNVTSAGNFNFTGGTIVFQNESSATTALDLGLTGGTGTKTTIGGTFQFGNASTLPNSVFNISGNIPLNSITSFPNADLKLVTDVVVGQLALNGSSSIDLNGNSIRLTTSAPGTYSFPLDNGSGVSIPVSVAFTSGTFASGAYIELETTGTKHTNNASAINYLNRFWTVTTSGITSPVYDVTATYANADIAGAEAEIATGNWTGSLPWIKGSDVNAGSNTISKTGITSTSFVFSGITSDPPTVTLTAVPAAICLGSSSNLTATPVGDGPFSYSWSPATGLSASNIANPVATPTVTTTYTVTVTDGNGFIATNNIQIDVNPNPEINNISVAAICSGGTFTATPTNVTDGIVPVGTTYTWATPSVAGITGAAAGTNAASISGTLTNTTNSPINVIYNVTPTSGICSGASFMVTVPVSPKPAITNIAVAALCSGGTFTTTPANGTDGIVPTGTTYSWAAPSVAGITGTVAGTSAANISGTLTNTTNSLINVVYSVTPTSGICPGASFTVTIPVSPKPAITNITVAAICSGGTFTTTPANGTDGIVPVGTTYTWTAPSVAGITGTVAGTSAANISGTLTNTTNSLINVVYSVTPTSGSCPGASFMVTVPVSPKPAITNITVAAICSGGTFTSTPADGTNGMIPAGTTYSWLAPTVAGITGTATGTNAANISGTLTNTTNTTINVIYTVTPTSGICFGASFTVTVPVHPLPTVTAPSDRTYCMGETTLAIPLIATPASGVTFDISGGAAIGLTDKIGYLLYQIPSYAATMGSATITITPRANGCTGTPVTFNVTVNPRPNIHLSASARTICSGESTNISISSTTVGATFSWEVYSMTGTITGASSGTGNLLDQTLLNNTATTGTVVYQITASTGACEGATINLTVTVHPEVTATITGTATACQNDSPAPAITFTATGGAAPYTFTYNINGGASQQAVVNSGNTATVTAPTNIDGTFTYNLVSVAGSTGCVYPQAETATITVKPLPVLTSTLTPIGICSNTSFNYAHQSSIPGTDFYWERKAVLGISNLREEGINTYPDETLINTTTSPIEVIYYYTLTADGCENKQEMKVMVTQSPVLNSTLTPASICSGTTFSYIPSSNINPGTSFSWTRAADSYGNSAKSGIYNPEVNPEGYPNEILYNNSTSTISVIYHFSLSSNGCTNPTDFQVIVPVVPAPVVWANANPTPICSGATVALSSGSNIVSGLPTNILNETFDGVVSGWTPNSVGNGTWKIVNSLNIGGSNQITNGGSKFYVSDMRTVNNTSTLTRSIFIDTRGYESVKLTFNHYYNDNNSSVATVRWSPDGIVWSNSNILATYNSDKGSRNSFTSETVNLPVGESKVYIQFRYQANNDYYWAIDDVAITGVPQATADILWTSNTSSWTSDQKDVSVSPIETTTYTVTYTDPNTGCSGSASTTVNVHPTPDATITANYCEASPKIRLRTGSFSSYNWSPLPLGQTNGNQYIDVEIAGIYTVNVIDANGCTGSASINVSNEYVVNGDFSAGNTGFVTPATGGNQYTYVANGGGNTELWPEGLYGIGTNAQNYHSNFWGVDHTTGSGNFMIVNGFPGAPQPIVWQQTINSLLPNTDYYFSAWAISLNSAGNDAQLRFSINNNQLGTIADLTTIPGVSNSSNSWHDEGRFYGVWNSGSNTSAILSIVDLQTAPSGNDFGIDDISFGILDPAPADIDPTSSNDVCFGEPINLYANVTDGKEPIVYTWTYPNGVISHDKDPVIPIADQTYDGTYTLKVTDWYGCDIPSETTTVTVHPKATVNAGPDQLLGCSATSIFDLNGSRGGAATSSTWTTSGSGTFDDATSLTAKYTISAADIAAGSVTLTLTTNDPTGPCLAASDDMVITINRSPELTVVVAAPLCAGFSDGSATATVTNGTAPFTYLWSNGQTTAKATGLVDGTYTVTVTDAKGCTDAETISVIEPTPLVVSPASFTPPTCYGGNDGTATVNAEGGTEPYVYQWDAAAGNQTTKTAVGLKVGIYLFTVTDANGCNITSDFVLVTQPEPPELLCPSDPAPVTVIGGATTAPVILTAPIYDPVCQILSWTMSGATIVSTPVAGIVPSPYTFNVGTTTVEYSAVNVAGEELTCTFDVVVIGGADLSITKTANPSPVNTGDPLVYTITVSNGGPSDAVNVSIADVVAALPSPQFTTDLTNGPWNPWVTPYLPGNLASGSSITIYVRGTVPLAQCGNIVNTATVSSDTNDNDLSNNSATITIPVADNQPPTFTPKSLTACVDMLQLAIYTTGTPNPNVGVDPNLIKNPSPDYYTFKVGNTSLDLTDVLDNCCSPIDPNDPTDPEYLTINWRIDFAILPDPLNPPAMLPQYPSISGTGQPSTYKDPITGLPADIYLWGDGVNFTVVQHQITYWVEDCHGNISDEQEGIITITPRPNIIKMNY